MTQRRSAIVLALALGPCACVTTIVEDDTPGLAAIDMSPVVIPLGEQSGGGAIGPVGQYYESVILQMQEALAEADEPAPEGGSQADRIRSALMRLRSLLATHDRSAAPDWAKSRFENFHAAASGLEFELHLADRAQIVLVGGAVPIGAPMEFAFRVRGMPGQPVTLGGSGAGLSFLATVTLRDRDAFGGTTVHRQSHILQPPSSEFDSDHPLDLSFGAMLEAADTAIREALVEVELLPGAVEVDGVEAPVHRVAVARYRELSYPPGVEVIREKPLATLQAALRLGDEKYFRHQFLAAHFMPSSEQRSAAELLVRELRLGTSRQARVSMAALREMTGAPVPVGDRDAWLLWWQGQVPAGR